jgi:hypothetical protein
MNERFGLRLDSLDRARLEELRREGELGANPSGGGDTEHRRTGRLRRDKAANLYPLPSIEKNISVTGFNLGGNLQHVPRALGEPFKFVMDGTVKVEITKYPSMPCGAATTRKRYWSVTCKRCRGLVKIYPVSRGLNG